MKKTNEQFLALRSVTATRLADWLQGFFFFILQLRSFGLFSFQETKWAYWIFGFFNVCLETISVGWMWGGGGGGGGQSPRRWLVDLAVCGWRSSRHIIRCLSSVSLTADVLVCLFTFQLCCFCFCFFLFSVALKSPATFFSHVVLFFLFGIRLNRNKRIWWGCLDLVAAHHCGFTWFMCCVTMASRACQTKVQLPAWKNCENPSYLVSSHSSVKKFLFF